MRKTLAILLAMMLFCLPFAGAEDAADAVETAWYELSADNTVLTVRLPGNNKDGMDWNFEISNPDALELITQEVIEGESEGMAGAPTTYAASFMSTASAKNTVSLILRYATEDPAEAPFATRVLELNIAEDNTIAVTSVLDRNQSADWIAYDTENFVLTVTLPAIENGSQAWDMSILDENLLELLTCETENGYIASFRSPVKGAGTTELSISTDNITYTVNVSVSETGDLFVEWVDTFTVLPAAWISFDEDNYIIVATVPALENEGSWSFEISDTEILELLTCESETGFVGSFRATLAKAGHVDLILTYGIEDNVFTTYTANLFVNESGEIMIVD